MLLFVIILLGIVSIALYLFDINEIVTLISGVIITISAIIATAMIVVIIAAHIGTSGTIRSMEEQYKALVFKANSEAVRDEFGLLNKEFIDEVQEWNKDIASGQEWQHDLWVGIFFPPIYDEFKTIDLESMEFKK